MLQTVRGRRGMVTSPHHLASQAGLSVLRDGGTAIDAAVTIGATLAVVYPHMTGIGGDGFWLIAEPGRDPVAIASPGRSGRAVTTDFYAGHGVSAIPNRGPLAANTAAGTIAGWEAALAVSRQWGSQLSLGRLLAEAIDLAEGGIVVSRSQAQLTTDKSPELRDVPGFAETFMPGGKAPAEGSVLRLPALAGTLRMLAAEGLGSFYRGKLAASMAADLKRAGAPIEAADLADHKAASVRPLRIALPGMELFNLPPPTQGLASLIILGLLWRQHVAKADGFDHVHAAVEATKLAFLVRDRLVGDPAEAPEEPSAYLDGGKLDAMAKEIDPARARPWPAPPAAGDTVWLGAIDSEGRSASYIQSLYFEFGSGVVLPESGVLWQNRGSSFELRGNGIRALRPRKLPFHTLNPAFARFADGRSMVYGTMGGDGQPQTQAAVFSRYAFFGQPLQEAVTAPRWLLGRTWGDASTALKVESRFGADVIEALRQAGHPVEVIPPFSDLVGHAGAIVRRQDGVFEGATDPRSDGAAMGW